ncbi:hypothetical protein Q5741_04735 [Paenibacillus sp. JX-17]|uniref:Protein kinase domain-containing protein n=1 Tax=Paenibacillus lacisoli TaxID=3064525 RepID=A0ABT9C8Y3_9BACL|nr:hypothetical protein [Paenibacillus sp. JX-17]MDO7905718.1 hypothetical protein [Paenibacillus sp. JX-17]
MSFQPSPSDEIVINERVYRIGQHPAAPGLAYAQAGRQGIVYQLIPVDEGLKGAKALKVFFPKYRIPAMVYQSEHMRSYSSIPGLQVCERDVLTPERNGNLIAEHPDLLYAVLMPWVHGKTWFDCLTGEEALTPRQSLELARSMAATGSAMEQRGLAHCDLSAPNVMLPFFSEVDPPTGGSAVEWVDVEQMYGKSMDRPDVLLAGSPGYAAHRTVQSGLWSSYADRFAGAVIISEMLGWCDEDIVRRGWGDSYFDPHEMQTPSERYRALRQSLESNWGSRLLELFVRTWESQDLSGCPTFGEWLVALNSITEEHLVRLETGDPEEQEAEPSAAMAEGPAQSAALSGLTQAEAAAALASVPEGGDVKDQLFRQARELERQEKWAAALEVYRSLHHFVEEGSALQVEVETAIAGLEEKLAPKKEPAGPQPWYRSKKLLISTAAALILAAGAIPAVNLRAEQLEAKKEAAAKLAAQEQEAAAAKAAEEARQTAAKDAAAAKEAAEKKAKDEQLKKQQAEQKLKQAALLKQQQAAAQQKKEAERKKLQEKYAAQEKYEAYLAAQAKIKQAAAKQREADRLKAQQEAERQAQLAREREEARQRAAAEQARKEAAARAAAAKERQAREAAAAQVLKKKRAQGVVELISYYNRAYNAQKSGNISRAREYASVFTGLYAKDAAYYSTVGNLRKRANAINKFISNSSYSLPNI